MSADLELGLTSRRRVRLVRQVEAAECGLAALTMVANFHGLNGDLAALRRRFEPSLRGAPLKSLIVMANALGMSSKAVKVPIEKLARLQLPAILHWNMNHYVVLERVSGGRALIHDPAGRSAWVGEAGLSASFTGVALELAPTEDFTAGRPAERLRLRQLWARIHGLKRALVQTLLLTALMQAFVLASPYYMQVAIDQVLPALDLNLLSVLAAGFGLFTLVNGAASLLRSFVLLSAGTSFSYGISVNLARRLFRLPLPWFEKRHTGDVLSRFQSVAPVRQFLIDGAIGTTLDGALTVLTLLVMLAYSVPLTICAVLAMGSYAVLRWSMYGAQRAAQDRTIASSAREMTTMIETLRGITTLRLYNREALRLAQWQAQLTEAMNAGAAQARLTAWQSTASQTIVGVEMIASVWIAIGAVIAGGFSLGMVFAYMAYKTMFIQRGMSFVDQMLIYRFLGLHLERLSDIAFTDEDASFDHQFAGERVLAGRVELRHVSFRYGPLEAPVISQLDLCVMPGEHVAITGPSGGGKSTLLKLILGLSEPFEGEVLVDGMPLRRFGYNAYREQTGAVLQDDNLFSGSLAENIALFDEQPDVGRIVQAAKDAALYDDINAMPMRFDTLVGDMGSTLSGGQRQRLLVARALYRRPRLLVIDEGTSNLDPDRERTVSKAIGELGTTRIVVAHRLETIMNADRVLRLEDGKLSDVTAETMAKRGKLTG